MSIAGRRGKLSQSSLATSAARWERSEDLLTADVFGAYRYLPPALGVLRFLSRAITTLNKSLRWWLAKQGVDLENLTVCDIIFWPQLGGCEPDVLLLLGTDAHRYRVAVLVEAKLHANQHTIEGVSQLGHYARLFEAGGVDDDDMATSLPSTRAVLYLTKHLEMPVEEISTARRELLGQHPESRIDIFWASWRIALEEADSAWIEQHANVAARPWLRLLADMADDIKSRGINLPRQLRQFPLPSLAPLASIHTALAAWSLV